MIMRLTYYILSDMKTIFNYIRLLNIHLPILCKIPGIVMLSMLLVISESCNKEVKTSDPDVEILSPSYQHIYLLPDTIGVKFKVVHDKPIEYIRISLVNSLMIPVSNQEFIYPDSSSYNGTISFILNALTDEVNHKPFYIHIVISDFTKTTHTYQEVELLNREMKYEGCYLLAKSGVDNLNISYYNSNFQKIFETDINGNYTDSEICNSDNLLILITNTPDKAVSLDCENGELVWAQDPQLPYPEFNKIYHESNIVYLSTAIGRIIGLTPADGIQTFTTLVLPDSIPLNICGTEDFLFTDMIMRHSNSKVWTTYYKETGSKHQVYQTSLETVNMYGLDNGNRIILFCNTAISGQVVDFNAENNTIDSQVSLDVSKINLTCKIDQTDYLFTSGNTLFHYNTQSQTSVKLAESNDNIIDIEFDIAGNRLFVAHRNEIEIFSFPDMNKIASIDSPYILKGIELKLGY